MLPLRKALEDKEWEAGLLESIDGLGDDEHARGKWPDGMSLELPEKASFIRNLSRTNKTNGAGSGHFWQGIHKQASHNVSVQQRVDRNLLMSVQEQSRQVAQVRIDSFGPVDDQTQRLSWKHQAAIDAGEFMKALAQDYCDDKIKKEDLNETKNQRLKEHVSAAKAAARPKAATKRVSSKQSDQNPKRSKSEPSSSVGKAAAPGKQAEKDGKPDTKQAKKPETKTPETTKPETKKQAKKPETKKQDKTPKLDAELPPTTDSLEAFYEDMIE
jgi:hypothetical protein